MDTLHRREFLAACAATGLALAGRAAGFQPGSGPEERFFEWTRLSERALLCTGFGGNALLLWGKEKSLLVDTKLCPYAMALRREAAAVLRESGAPALTHVVNTHHHADHTGGNHAFTPDLEVLAQTRVTGRVLGQMNRYISQLKEVPSQLKGKSGPAEARVVREATQLYHDVLSLRVTKFCPRTTFDSTWELDLGGEKITMTHFGAGHTDNDVVVHAPAMDLVHTGDLVFHKLHPVIDRDSGADTASWLACLDKARALCTGKTIVVPGHGAVTDRAGIDEQAAYLRDARGVVGAAIKAGRSRAEVAQIEMPAYKGYATSESRPTSLLAIYSELSVK